LFHKFRWTPQKIAQRIRLIEPLVYRQHQPIPNFRYTALESPLVNPPVGAEIDDSGWEEIQPNTYWGRWRTDFVLRSSFSIPAHWDKNSPVGLYLPIGVSRDFSHPEGLAYIDGQPYASADRHHHEIRLNGPVRDGKTHRFELVGWTGGDHAGDPNVRLYMKECSVVLIDQPTRDFIAAARVAHGVAVQLDDNNQVKALLFNALDAAFQVLDTRDPLGTDAFYDSVPDALKTLKAGVAAAGEPMNVDIIGIGHAHIDVAWLWTLGQVVRKSGRTFSNVLRLMEEFPDYTFSQSQPQLYSYTEKHYPEIFAQIKERVAEGRWEPMGGTWVEPDINAIGAESLARQFLLGRGYFRKHFGDVDTPVLWLPDTFGYSWALPQLIKQAGMKWFITHKMSWNQYNQMPHQILWWQGIDGTKVLTHFLTTPTGDEFLPYSTTYNADISPKQIIGTWTNFRQKELHNELITAYGYGDGGGGPTREMIENVHEFKAMPGAPRVRAGTIREFMDRLEAEAPDNTPVWNGEFYLEYHRGTFTSQARNKRNNRKSEFLMHDAEFLATLAALTTDYAYPHEEFAQAWELICLNQFHDILPGSSINEVYVDSTKDYQIIEGLGCQTRDAALEALGRSLPANSSILVANPTSFAGRRMGLLQDRLKPGTHLVDGSGNALAVQVVENGTLIEFPHLEAYSVGGLKESTGEVTLPTGELSVTQSKGGVVFENALVRAELDGNGEITRLYDKQAGREVLAPNSTGNVLLAFEDRPMNYDAWDIDIFYEDRTEKVEGVESIEVVEQGPLRVGIEIKRRYRSSQIHQKITLTRDSKRLDFETWVDWHEHHILLKVAFPVDVMSPAATFEVQWGNVERATHRNTTWEWARFETCAHKWADLSEGNYGVALLNDCKYGYDVHDNVMRLSLLKSATSPDPQADQGEHFMTYSLLPHEGDWRSEVIPAAYDLNDPLIVWRVLGGSGAGEGSVGSLVSTSVENAVIETVKQAEDGNGVIVRLYEDHRFRNKVTVKAGFAVAEAYHTNLLEENETKLDVVGDAVTLDITPYQIATIRFVPKA
jgi:alpha-mannosidase